MYPSNQYQQPYRQYYSQRNQKSSYKQRGFDQPQIFSSPSASVTQQCKVISQRALHLSSDELTRILDELFNSVENSRNERQRLSNLKDIVTAIIRVRRSVLTAVVQHRFFTLLHTLMSQILRQWTQNSHLEHEEVITLRNLVKLLKLLFREITEVNSYPSWFTDASLIDAIALCLVDMSKSGRLFDKSNGRVARQFIRLFDLYNDYQDLVYMDPTANQDKLVVLVDPVVQCLTSNSYFDSLDHIARGAATLRSKKDKFFLIRCPTFLTAYHGSRLDQTMTDFLSTILPKYTTVLGRLISSVDQWTPLMMRSVSQLLQIVNQGSNNPNVLTNHQSLIDYVLSIIDTPLFSNNLQETLSHPQTNLMHSAVSLLANYINEPTVLAHIKQKKTTPIFLRLTSAKYEPLVYNTSTILAHTTSEEDIKSMHNPGNLLSTVVKGLRTEMEKKSADPSQVIQLTETLKGLMQHDQLKEEIFKQNIYGFLLECTNRFPPAALTLLLETFWSLSFSPELATVLRHNQDLLKKVQTISNQSNDEGLKKAADGLVWKLIREPAFLDKVAKEAAEETIVTQEVIIGADGKEQVVITTKKSNAAPIERVFAFDIMISYCHADQDLIKKIHKFLMKEGFKVWIDLDHMFGPAMNAMAEAVENSEFVLLCMSDSYKQSTYCQAEAEYAFGCKRRLVPLIVRPGYRADGWLGFMIGARIYVDYGTFDFETACGKLMVEMERQRQRPLPSKVAQTTAAAAKSGVAVDNSPLFSQKLPEPYTKRKTKLDFDRKRIDRWVESDVLDFLYSHQLNEMMPVCEKMDGPALIQLYKMSQSHNNRTFNILSDQLNATYKLILPIGTYTKFLSIMEKVVSSSVHFMKVPSSSQLMLPGPSQQLMLPAPTYLRQSTYEPATRNSKLGYDVLVTSNAPASKILSMVERRGSRWHVNDSGHY